MKVLEIGNSSASETAKKVILVLNISEIKILYLFLFILYFSQKKWGE